MRNKWKSNNILRGRKMKSITILIVTLMLVTLIGCGKKDDTSLQSEEKKTVTAPRMDLHSAILRGNIKAVKQHIEAGSDLNIKEATRKSTPLITATFIGYNEAVKLLIDAGANLNYQNLDGSTALHTAAVFGKIDAAKMLIDAGTNLNLINKDGASVLHTAAFFCRLEIVEALLKKGVDKTLKNKTGHTAFQTVVVPFEVVEPAYDEIGKALKPFGIEFDYDHLKVTRPKIAAMLK